jgi:hypothetical protein
LVLLFGLLVLNAASGVADAAACHGGDHIQALSQAPLECRTDPSHHVAPCGMLKPCTSLSCMGVFIADGPHDPEMLSEKSLRGWTSAEPLHGWVEPPPVKPPRTQT